MELFESLILTHFHFQPAEFNQIEHERRFKSIFKGLTIVITVIAISYCILAHFIEPEGFLRQVPLLDGDAATEAVSLIIPRIMVIVTAIVMVTSEVCAHIMRFLYPESTSVIPLIPVCSVGFVKNNIPFLTLNFSIGLGMLVKMILDIIDYTNGGIGIQFCAILVCLLASNKKARKHVLLRMRQKYDTMSIGHWTLDNVTCPHYNAVDPGVSIALVPLPLVPLALVPLVPLVPRREWSSALPTPARLPKIRVAR